MPRLSIIIPVVSASAEMDDTLASVLANRPPDCEILVVLAQAYDDPYQLRGEVSFIEAPRGSRLVDCINLGIAVSRAPLVHILPCGMEAAEGWAEAGTAALADSRVAAVVPMVVPKEGPERIVSVGVAYRPWGSLRAFGTRQAISPSQVQALVDPDWPATFYRKSALDAVGRFSAKVGDWLSPVELGLLLRHVGLRTVLEPRCRVLASRRPPCRPGSFIQGWAMERLFWRWVPQHSRAWVGVHLVATLLQCLMLLPRPISALAYVIGRTVGALQIRAHRTHWQVLSEMPPETPPPLAPDAPHFLQRAKADSGVRELVARSRSR